MILSMIFAKDRTCPRTLVSFVTLILLLLTPRAYAAPEAMSVGDAKLDRLLATSAPEHETFQAVLERACAIERKEPEHFKEILPALEQALASWPDTMRHTTNSAGGRHSINSIRHRALPGCFVLVRSLMFGNAAGLNAAELRSILYAPVFSHLTRLETDVVNFYGDSITALTESPSLTNLRHLEIKQANLDEDSVRSIIDSPNLARVTSLGLGGNHLRTEGIEPLVTSPAAGRLRHLGLFKNNLGFADVVALANAPHLANLTSLDLSWNALCGDHRKPYGIAAIEKLTKLERLDIRAAAGSCRFEPEPLVELLTSPALSNLREVDVSGHKGGDQLAIALATSGPTGIERLGFRESQITAAGVEALATSDRFAGLKELDVSFNLFGDAGVAKLLDKKNLPSLERLYMTRVGATNKGIISLERANVRDDLDHLSLAMNELGPAAAKALVKLDLSSLSFLDLSYNKLGDAGAETVIYAPTLQDIALLHVIENGVSVKMKKSAMRSRLGKRKTLSI